MLSSQAGLWQQPELLHLRQSLRPTSLGDNSLLWQLPARLASSAPLPASARASTVLLSLPAQLRQHQQLPSLPLRMLLLVAQQESRSNGQTPQRLSLLLCRNSRRALASHSQSAQGP